MQLMRARLSVLPVMGAETMGTIKTPQAMPAAPGCAWWQLITPTLPTSHDYPRAAPAPTGGSSGARPPPPEPYRAHPRPPTALPGGSFRNTTAPRITPNTPPKKIVPSAHPRAPGDTLSPGEGILPQFTHPRGSDGEFSAAGSQLRERKNSGFDPKGDASIIQLNNIAVWVKIYILDK